MRKNNGLVESISTTIGALVVLMLGTAVLLGLAWLIIVIVKAIMGL